MEKTMRYEGSTITYTTEGNGTPVVLLHGFGEDSRVFESQVSFLLAHCKLIVPDLPGSGKSEILKQPEVSMTDYADVVYALLQQEKISSCILLGHSMGGYITLAFAEKYMEMLTGFGLIHSTAFADSHEKKDTRRKGIEFIKKNGAYSFLKSSIPNLFSASSKEKQPEAVSALIEEAKSFTSDALIQYYQAMIARPDRTAVLKQSNVPVLLIAGTEDNAVPLNDILKQASLPNTSYIHVLDGVGHMGMLEQPAKINNFIREFVSEVQS